LHGTESEAALTARKVWGIRRWVEDRLATFSEIVVMAWESPDRGGGRDSIVTIVRILYGPGQIRQFKLRKPILEVSEGDIAAHLPLS
jgi:hypothetical protein